MFFSFRALLSTSLCSGLSFCMLAPASALADSTDLMSRSTLTGDWGGERQKLVDKGIKPVSYTHLTLPTSLRV